MLPQVVVAQQIAQVPALGGAHLELPVPFHAGGRGGRRRRVSPGACAKAAKRQAERPIREVRARYR